MSDLKATPGPWFVYADDEVRQTSGPVVIVPDSALFADDHSPYSDDVDTRDRRKANAHLIAASPELYEALLEYVDDLESDFTTGNPRYQRARAALAKARGES